MRKNFLKSMAVVFVLTLTLGCVACGTKTSTDNSNSATQVIELPDGTDPLAAKLANEFAARIAEGKSPLEIAEILGNEDFCGYSCATSEFEEGYLNGFAEEITGFKSCAGFMPWIGSVPFVGYIFELEAGTDAGEFAANLKSLADPRWNICTSAKDPVTVVIDNYVFITMVPEE